MRSIAPFVATWAGMGRLPWAPGTWGTVGAIPLYLLLSLFPRGVYLAFLPPFFLLACWSSKRTEVILAQEDDPRIVIDEVLGFLVTMTALPPKPFSLLIGVILFRLLDILKPLPISLVERRMKGGMGVIIDDLIAGLIGHGILRLILLFRGV